jgi:hypothetical protein
MNVEIGAAQFLFWEYINGIFVTVYCKASPAISTKLKNMLR